MPSPPSLHYYWTSLHPARPTAAGEWIWTPPHGRASHLAGAFPILNVRWATREVVHCINVHAGLLPNVTSTASKFRHE
ncbi:hypothetical protein BS78_03G133600 [Paspalum vaginatum]|nr:hypothetical protein BS78_03G133600 [Paspalum vaginatum]